MAKTTTTARRPQPAPQRAQVPARPQQKTVATREDSDAPAHIVQAAQEYEGAGISHRAEDNIVPLIYLLQVNSPPAMRGHERYIKGAEGGDIWLRNAPPEIAIVKGEDGILFQPCNMKVSWIEWMPDRGGFVARHDERPEAAVLTDVESDDGTMRKRWQMPSGNAVVETREFSGFVHGVSDAPLPYTIPLSSTGHTVGKAWNTTMRDWRVGGRCPPMWSHLFRLTTKMFTKNNNSWYQYSVEHEGFVPTAEDLERGRVLHEAFASGEKRSADVENLDGTGTVIDGSGDDNI